MVNSIVSTNFLKWFCQHSKVLSFTSFIKLCRLDKSLILILKGRNTKLTNVISSQIFERCFHDKYFLYARQISSPKSSRPARSESHQKNESEKEVEQNENEENNEQDKEKSDKDSKKAKELKEMLEKMFGKNMGNKVDAELNKFVGEAKLARGGQFIALILLGLYILFKFVNSMIFTSRSHVMNIDQFMKRLEYNNNYKILLWPNDYRLLKQNSKPVPGRVLVFTNDSFTNNNFPIGIIEVPDLNKFVERLRNKEIEFNIPPERWTDVSWRKISPFSYIIPTIFLALIVCLPLFLTFRLSKRIDISNLFSSSQRIRIIDPASKEGKKNLKIKFRDVAGLHEAKREVMEIVDYLRKPQKYVQLGARLPKGALLTGPPGCGKTLLAKALAAESSVPFINVNGTEFVEMIGGLGASRVRQLFKTANSRAPCIIYIDEIDALGRKRQNDSGNDEMEQTLNQLLVEMDGMEANKGVVVVGSTNRVDMLDKALLRPGRFDRHITIDLPTVIERRELFDLYLKKIKRDNILTGVSQRLAQMTPGFSGADIKNVVNEAAIHAATAQKKMVKIADIEFALQKIIAGPEKRSRVLIKEEREIVAFHESGHALVGWLLEHTEALLRVTIIPRTSAALGFAQYSPKDRKLFTKEELFDRLCMMLGGRAAENVTFGKITTGAQNDLEKVTKQAQAMVKWYGMSELIGPISFFSGQGVDLRSADFTEKPYSKKLGNLIDQEISKIVSDAYYFTERLLRENKDKLDTLAKALLERETLNYEDVKQLIGPPKYGNKQVVDLPEDVLPDLPNQSEIGKENNKY